MKILKVKHNNGEAAFVVEGFPTMTFCVKLEGKTSKQQVIDELKTMIPNTDKTKDFYNNKDIKSLEETDI